MRATIKLVLATAVAASSLTSFAANEHDGHGGMAGMGSMGDKGGMHAQAPAAMSTAMVDGTVKKIDKAASKVTLAHGPLTNLGMNMAMTMAFRVKDAVWLDQMKEGDKIRFAADNVNGQLTITQFERVDPAK